MDGEINGETLAATPTHNRLVPPWRWVMRKRL
jgi:hypothetical protein